MSSSLTSQPQNLCICFTRSLSVFLKLCPHHFNPFCCTIIAFHSVLWCCWLGDRKGIRPVKIGCWFVHSDDLAGALPVLWLQLLPANPDLWLNTIQDNLSLNLTPDIHLPVIILISAHCSVVVGNHNHFQLLFTDLFFQSPPRTSKEGDCWGCETLYVPCHQTNSDKALKHTANTAGNHCCQ